MPLTVPSGSGLVFQIQNLDPLFDLPFNLDQESFAVETLEVSINQFSRC